METLQPPRPHTRITAYARAIVLVNSTLLFPFCVLYCPIAAVAVILVAVGTAFVAAIHEDYVYAKSFRGYAETLQAALGVAKGRVTAMENENQTLRALQGMLVDFGPGPTVSSEQYVASLEDEDGIVEDDLDASCPDTTQCITSTEIELLDEQLQSDTVSIVDLYISLRYATEHIAELITELEQTKREHAVTDRRMHQLEQDTHNLQQQLAHAHIPINSNLCAVEQLKADLSAAVTSKSEETPNIIQTSHTTTMSDFRFPPEEFIDAVEQQSENQHTTPSTPTQEHTATHGFAKPRPTRRRASTATDAKTPFEQEIQAARIETIIKRRVYKKVDLAFEVCRKQGRFGNEERPTIVARDASGMHIGKVRVDSLKGVEEALKEIARQRRGRKVRRDSSVGEKNIAY